MLLVHIQIIERKNKTKKWNETATAVFKDDL